MVRNTRKTRGGGKPQNRQLVLSREFDSRLCLRWGASWTLNKQPVKAF
ncbi:hypothetical protein CKA32_000026 [Geitlerinema sp. FC II]|nr:hypothetical protein CKA32_000026 [Geitlerinema sp. FC II]